MQFVKSGRGILAVLALVAFSPAVEAQTIRGTVTDAGSGEPLAGVRVWLLTDGGAELGLVMTEAGGRYQLQPDDPGTYRLRASRIGYLAEAFGPVVVREGEAVEVELALHPDPVRLPGVEVEVDRLPSYEIERATYTGLYLRRSNPRWATPGGNRVFVRGDLEPHTGATVWEFIERYAPMNIQKQLRNLRSDRRRAIQAELFGSRLPARADGCPLPSFFIRGFDFGRPRNAVDGLPITVETYLNMPLREIEGIEFYRHSIHAPLELRPSEDPTGGSCGVVVIWPRQAEGTP